MKATLVKSDFDRIGPKRVVMGAVLGGEWEPAMADLCRNWSSPVLKDRTGHVPAAGAHDGEQVAIAEGGNVFGAWIWKMSPSAIKAFEAIQFLAANPDAVLKAIRESKPPGIDETAKRVDELIAQLDHPRFKVREDASKELGRLGIEAKKAIEEAVKRAPSEDAKVRMENLLKRLDSGAVAPEWLREFRVMEILERIGTPEAREQIDKMAKGPAESAVTREAKAIPKRWLKS